MELKMNHNPISPPLVFGFDIGIASVGWAVLAPDHIIALGVRAFDAAETPDKGEPLNQARRTARLARHRLQHRAARLKKVARTLKQHGVISDARLFQPEHPFTPSLWHLRVEALDRKLGHEEWARVIYHLCKHRGFYWVSRAEKKKAAEDTKGEVGAVKKGLATTTKLMKEKGYRSAAEMVLKEFPTAQRNKRGDYGKALGRELLGEELAKLFERQRELGNPHANVALEAAILGTGDRKTGLFWEQKPAIEGDALLKMLGKCTFEKAEWRAPKASFTAERHVWLTRLNNLRLAVDGEIRSLNTAERQLLLPLPYQQAGDLTYKQAKAALIKAGLTDTFRFHGLPYPSSAQEAAGKAKNPEDAPLIKLPAWQALRLTLKKEGLETEWEGMAAAALERRSELLDDIAWVLSVYKDDDAVRAKLNALALPNKEKMIEALLDLHFDKFHALSLQALRNIVPHMERGLRYDEACAQAGYNHSQPQTSEAATKKTRMLPSFYKGSDKNGRLVFNDVLDVPRNPVVLRALNQARKVLNALVRTYGSPHEVRIEMARDLSRPKDERKQIEKEQKQYRDMNDADKAEFKAQFGHEPSGVEFEKWRLYREQDCKCAYSVTPIDLHRLLEPGYVEVDHALPWSRSYDNSKNNKVLVHAKENRDKGNQTPHEYLDGAHDSPQWRQFVAFVETNKKYRQAKRSRLLRKNFGEQDAKEFRERNLNDTRYICRFFKNYVESALQLADDSDAQRCVVVSGQMTAFMRARWGLMKVRDESDRHHALDAAVVAACTHGMVKRLSDYSRRKELEHVRTGFVDMETGEIANPHAYAQLERHFPAPWPYFRDELLARLKLDDPAQLRADMEQLGTYSQEELASLRPLFVSRAPQRRIGGAAHKDTIYAQREVVNTATQAAKIVTTEKVALTKLKLSDLDQLVDPHRNEKLYTAIRTRLEAHDDKADKAFAPNNPLFKPDRDGNPTGPIVRSVTKTIEKITGVPVRGGIAINDTLLRTDVFSKDGRYFLVPVYVHHRVSGLPNRAIVQGKDESAWTLVDDSFLFIYALHPNDLVKITLKTETRFGYYSGCDRSTGAVHLWAHDRNSQVGKDGLIRSIGVKTALKLEKFNVDVLGNIYPAQPETRHGLA